MTSWYQQAKKYIGDLDKTLPAEMSYEDRRKAVSAAYPWGQRKFLPYKMWLKASKEYLNSKFNCVDDVPVKHLSPLERMMKRAGK